MTEPFDEHREPDPGEARLERALRRLGEVRPEPGRSDAAVAAAVARLQSAPAGQPNLEPKSFPIRRWIMRASVAATAAAIVLAFWVSVTPSSSASAAEVLREAIAKRTQFAGTVELEQWDAAKSKWAPRELSQPSLGRTVRWADNPDGTPPGTPVPWTYLDTKQKVQAEYRTDLKSVYVADVLAEPNIPPTPFDEQTLLDEIGREADQWSSRREEKGGEAWLIFSYRPRPQPTTTPSGQVPAHFRVVLDKTSGLIRSIDVAEKDEPAAFQPHYRYIYKDPTPTGLTWESLPVPEGTPRVDNRLTPEIRAWLGERDALFEQGIGFDTAVVVRRSEHPFGGGIASGGSVAIYSGKPGRWMHATWNVGGNAKSTDARENPPLPLPEGWPNSTFDAVMKVVREIRPHQFMAYDGDNVWRIDQNGKVRATDNPEHDGSALWRRTGLPSLIWQHSSELMGGSQALFSQAKVEEIRGEKVIKFTRLVQMSDQPGRLKPYEITRLNFRSGPWAEFRQDFHFWIGFGELPETIWQWNYDVGSQVMYREPVRVPTAWRRVVLDTKQSPAYIELTRLIPAPKAEVPAEWFGDPRKVWGGE